MSTIEAKFEENTNKIQNIDDEINVLEKELQYLTKKRMNTTKINDVLEIDSQIYNCENNIKHLKNKSINDYLLKITPIIKEFNNNNVDTDIKVKGELFNFFSMKTNNNKGQLFTKYMQYVENSPPIPDKNEFDHICKTCNVVKRISPVESLMICPECGDDEMYFDIGVQGLTYEQEIHTDTNVHFAYKRINHFRELLCQLQAKESSNIPINVIDNLRYEFKKERITNTDDITHCKVKMYLKKLKFNKYYENSYQITNILTGKPPPTISNDLYEKFIMMFMQIQEPFEKVCPSTRKNFLSYNYVLYKFCELLNENELINFFSLLKSRQKLYHQDCIWKGICEILGWKFINSV